MGAVRERSLREDIADVVRVIAFPVRTFRGRRDRPALLGPWITLSVAMVILTVLTLSVTQRAAVHLLTGIEDTELAAHVAQQLRVMKVVAVVLAPVQLLLNWGVAAALFRALGTFLVPGLGFRMALTVAAFAGVSTVMGRGLDLAVTWWEGPQFGPDLSPLMESASSLAALLPAASNPGASNPGMGTGWEVSLMRQITAFSVWGGALWIVGLREAAGTSWTRATLVGASVWVAFTAVHTTADALQASLLEIAKQTGGGR